MTGALGTGSAIAGGGHRLLLPHRAPGYTRGETRSPSSSSSVATGTPRGAGRWPVLQGTGPVSEPSGGPAQGPCRPFTQTDPAAMEPRAAGDPRRQHHATDAPKRRPCAPRQPCAPQTTAARRNYAEPGAGGVRRPATVASRPFPRRLRQREAGHKCPPGVSGREHGQTGTSRLPGRPPRDRLGRS